MIFEGLREKCIYEAALNDETKYTMIPWFQYMRNMIISIEKIGRLDP